MRLCMPLVGIKEVVLWSVGGDSESLALLACTSRASEGLQVGQSVGDDSHGGPCLHSVELTNC